MASIVFSAAPLGVGVHARGDAVGGEDHGLALGHLGLLLDEDRAALAQLLDHVLVVDDLLAHVNGRRRRARARARPSARRDRRPRSSRAARRAGASPGRSPSAQSLGRCRGPEPPASSPGRTGGRLTPMATRHMDRLSAIDASFLAQESRASHMHVGGVMIFEGPPPGHAGHSSSTSPSRLHLVPRYRQKLAVPRFEMGRPLWVDDPTLQPRVPRAPHGAAVARLGRAAAAAGRRGSSPSGSTARSRCGSCGCPGARGRPLRDHQQDPPRARGRRLRRRHRHGAVRPRARCRQQRGAGRRVDAAPRAVAGASWSPRA